MTRFFLTATAALALGGAAFAEEQGNESFDDFQTALQDKGLYTSMDADGDGNVTEDEFNEGMFKRYDTDGDGELNEDEMATMGSDSLFADETSKAGNAATEAQD